MSYKLLFSLILCVRELSLGEVIGLKSHSAVSCKAMIQTQVVCVESDDLQVHAAFNCDFE